MSSSSLGRTGVLLGTLAAVLACGGQPPPPGAQIAQRPFARNSPWNQPILADASELSVAGLNQLPIGLSSWLRPNESSVPVFRATATSRYSILLYNRQAWAKLRSGRWRNANNSARTERDIRLSSSPRFPLTYHPYVSQSAAGLLLPTQFDPIRKWSGRRARSVRLPPGAAPNSNSDGHMVVIQPDGQRLETYATIVLSDGAIVCLSYQTTDPNGLGDGHQNGITASMVSVYAGLVTAGDLRRGGIHHALKVVAPASLLRPAFVYPALAFDRGALRETPPYSGLLPMGARLGFRTSESRRLTLRLATPLGRRIAEAVAHYGMIITDRGGQGLTIVTERFATPRLPSAAERRDLGIIGAHLVWRPIGVHLAPNGLRRMSASPP